MLINFVNLVPIERTRLTRNVEFSIVNLIICEKAFWESLLNSSRMAISIVLRCNLNRLKSFVAVIVIVTDK